MNSQSIKVLLVEDHIVVREGLRMLLKLTGEFEIIGEAGNGHEAIEMVRDLKPDIVLMDVALPILNGIEATRQIHLEFPDCKVLVLSAHGDDEYVERLIAVGASGYLIKQNSGKVLMLALREIISGRTFFSNCVGNRLRQQEEQARLRGDKGSVRRPLTAREAEVLQMIAEGYANKEIAAQLNISIKTVEKHRQQLMDKLNIHETAGLTRHAIDAGVIECASQDENSPKYRK